MKVLFLCTGNSARSIIAEYLLRDPRFEAYSAGSNPKGEVHPLALRLLKEVYRIDANDLSSARSKSWEEYEGVHFDFVITVCDNAKESCPAFPGQPIAAHWGVPDPADFEGPEDEHYALFKEAGRVLARRIELFCNLPFDKLDRLRLQEMTREIGASRPVEA